jgi:hypothetical protein
MTLIIQKPTGAKLNLRQQYVPLDANYSSVSLLLHGDGPNGSTVFTDNSPAPKTVTAAGNAQISTAQSKFGGTSLAFDGNGDALSVAGLSGLSQFTMTGVVATYECWLYLSSLPGTRSFLFGSFGTGDSGWTVDVNSSGNIFIGRNAGGLTITLSSAFTTSSWQHLAVVSDGTTIVVYRNGISVGSVAASDNLDGRGAITSVTQDFRIGARQVANVLPLNGYIDDLRVTQSVARYITNFTPPIEPFPNGVNG